MEHCKKFTCSIISCRREGTLYVMDCGFLDFDRLYRSTVESAFFVVRKEQNMALHQRYCRPVGRSTGQVGNQTVLLATANSLRHYPDALRRVCCRDGQTGRQLSANPDDK